MITAYADGSCFPNPGPTSGAGVVVLYDHCWREEASFELGPGTNNTAELHAVRLAAERIGPRDEHVVIYTDSQYTIGVLENDHWKLRTNKELIEEIRDLLALFGNLELKHVKGHSGDPMNERVDELAGDAREHGIAVPWRDF